MATPAYKTIDAKGRLTLGREFAGKTVKVEKDAEVVVLRFYRMVPDHEAWLWENETATAMVARGLEQARSGDFADGPDLASAFDFAESVPDEE
jgi:hypothetical protein